MAYNIVVKSGQFVIVDDSTGEELIRNLRSDIRFEFDNTTSTYFYFYREPTRSGGGAPTFKLYNKDIFTFADLNTITDEGVNVVKTTTTALSDFLGDHIGFFLPDSDDTLEDINESITDGDAQVISLLKALIMELRINNKYLSLISDEEVTEIDINNI